jgi:uncharacterized protein YyaL (SSP411 family)
MDYTATRFNQTTFPGTDAVGRSFSAAGLVLDFAVPEAERIALVGDFTCGSTASLLRASHGVLAPHKVVLGNAGPVEEFTRTLPVNEEFTQAFCCTGNACQPPTRDKEKVREFLGNRTKQ